MESHEYPQRHFQAMTKLAGDLRAVPAQIIEHAYNYGAFGSWWTTVQRKGFVFRIAFDGKERQLTLERAGAATGSWEALASWPTGDDEGEAAIRQAVDRLRAV
jgi:hypothetical protein